MRWELVVKRPNSDLDGDYTANAVKDHIRIEANYRCVYCALHENNIGGMRAFHVEHYKPKSRAEFSHLEHILSNLYYSCPICNGFKQATWPNDPMDDFSVASYPDPAVVDYNSLFTVDSSGQLEGLYVASAYVTEQLYLNRPQLILHRREAVIDQRMEEISNIKSDVVNDLITSMDSRAKDYLKRIHEIDTLLRSHLLEAKKIPLYERADVTRPRR